MNPWQWLTRPDPTPGFTTTKLLKLLARVLIFAVIATILSELLRLTPLGQYLDEWWGSLLFVLILYIPAAKLLSMNDFFVRPAPTRTASGGKAQTLSSAERRKERNRYAGVKKGAPRQGGRR